MRPHGKPERKIYRSVSAILSQSKGRYSSIFAWGLSPRGSLVWQLRHMPLLMGGPASCGWWAMSQHNLFGFTAEWQLFKIGSGLHTPLDSFLFHFKSFPWDSLNSSIFLMTNYPSIPLEMKSSFCLAISLFIYFPSSWVYMYVALNGQCIKMPLFIFFSFALLSIMAIIKLLEPGKYRFFLLRQAAFVYVFSCRLANMLNFLFHLFLWYRWLYVSYITFLNDAWN